MARNTTKEDLGTTKHDSTSGCLAKNKSDKGRLVANKNITTNKKESSHKKRDAVAGRFVDHKPARNEGTSVKGSKADRMFERAWKDTYEKRERRVG